MGGLIETGFGFLGAIVLMITYQYQPMLAIFYVGFHIGIHSYRASRRRASNNRPET